MKKGDGLGIVMSVFLSFFLLCFVLSFYFTLNLWPLLAQKLHILLLFSAKVLSIADNIKAGGDLHGPSQSGHPI